VFDLLERVQSESGWEEVPILLQFGEVADSLGIDLEGF